MFWILNERFSQDWDGELTGVKAITEEHELYERYNKSFMYEYGEPAKGGYIVFDKNFESELIIGFDSPAEKVYDAILDQIAKHHDVRVIDIRGFGYVGIV